MVIDAVEKRAGAVENRRQQESGENRIDVESAADYEHGIGADDGEGRMRDVDDIEQAERNGGAHAERRVEAAEQ